MSKPPNGSVKKKRSHLWDREPNDWYVEPEEITTALLKAEPFDGEIIDPAAGMGRIVKAARAAGFKSRGFDLINRGYPNVKGGVDVFNFHDRRFDNIISNGPFKFCAKHKGEERWRDFIFVKRCLDLSQHKTALLLPADWDCGVASAEFCQVTPLARVYRIVPRVSMPPGKVIEAGLPVGSGRQNFAWYVWQRGYKGETLLRYLNWRKP